MGKAMRGKLDIPHPTPDTPPSCPAVQHLSGLEGAGHLLEVLLQLRGQQQRELGGSHHGGGSGVAQGDTLQQTLKCLETDNVLLWKQSARGGEMFSEGEGTRSVRRGGDDQ